MRRVVTIAWLATGLAGCQLRATPHRFANPLLGGARLATLEPGALVAEGPRAPSSRPARAPTALDPDGGSASRAELGPDVRRGDLDVAPPADGGTSTPRTPGSVVISRLPGPHRATSAPAFGSLAGVTSAPTLLGVVGTRDEAPPLAWALAASAALGGSFDALDRSSGAALLAAATGAGRATPASRELAAHVALGDLLVFDRAVAGAPASLVAVVLGVDARGVITMMYLGGGIVRRGLLCPADPTHRRDARGAALNTYLRHNKDWPPDGTKFLAGELVAASIRAR